MGAAEEPLPAEEEVEVVEEPSPEAEREEVVVAEKPSVDRKRMRKGKLGGLDKKRHEIRHDLILDCLLHLSVLYVSQLTNFNPNFMNIYLHSLVVILCTCTRIPLFSIYTFIRSRVPLFRLTEKGGTCLLAMVNRITPILKGQDHSGPSPTWLSWGRLMHFPVVPPTDPDFTVRFRHTCREQTVGWSDLQLQLHPWTCPNFGQGAETNRCVSPF